MILSPDSDPRSSLDLYIDKYRRAVSNIDFAKKSKFSNLSSEEEKTLISLRRGDDFIIKPDDKSGTVVVLVTPTANFLQTSLGDNYPIKDFTRSLLVTRLMTTNNM